MLYGAPSPHLSEFDALRGLLALWVVAFHIGAIAGYAVPWFLDGAYAVDVFIILSGFVITLLRTSKPEKYLAYLIRRFFRLWPVFAVMIATTLLLVKADVMPRRFSDENFLLLLSAHAFMLHGALPTSLVPNGPGAFLNPSWSVSLEWQFYLIAPVLVRCFRTPIQVFAIALLVVAVTRAMAYLPLGDALLPAKAGLFWVGISSAVLYRCLRPEDFLIMLGALLGAVAIFAPLHRIYGIIIFVIFMAIMMIRPQVYSHTPSLKNRTLVFLGAISYPIYLCHEPVIWMVKYLCPGGSASVAAVSAVVGIPITLVSAWMLHRFIERPGISLGAKLARFV